MEPIDRAALREKARAFWCGRCVTSPGTLESPCEMCGSVSGTVLTLLDALDAAERVQGEAIAHCRASGEPCWCGAHTSSVGDGEATAPLSAFPGHVECGRALDAAERERDQARADLRTYGEHRDDCHIAIWMRCADEPPAPACTCGYSEALARAEGR